MYSKYTIWTICAKIINIKNEWRQKAKREQSKMSEISEIS